MSEYATVRTRCAPLPRSGRSTAWLLALAAWLAACAGLPAAITPVNGVATVTGERTEYSVIVPSGSGKFRVVLPAGARIRVTLRYAEDRLFERIAGVEVVDNRSGSLYRGGYPGITDDGRWRIYVTATEGPLDIMLTVVDAYR
jgi:hypothetical protein